MSRLPRACVEDQLAVERLGEARVDDPDRPALGGQPFRGRHRPHDDRPEADEQDVGALAQHLALADRDDLGLDRRQVEARVARIVERERVVLGEAPSGRATAAPARPWAGDDEVRQLALGRAA